MYESRAYKSVKGQKKSHKDREKLSSKKERTDDMRYPRNLR
jgi:hypothetical protein